jgi:putative acetyltransferase
MKIRLESEKDINAIRILNDKAFGSSQEGKVIDKLRELDPKALSLVAEIKNKVVGHIFYSTAEIDCNDDKIVGLGLAPMAVLPKYQKQGIGKMLIKESISIIKKSNIPFIIVLEHKDYYPKFGFEKASKFDLRCQWEDVSDEAFMIMILDKEKMKDIHGIAKYRDEWEEAM